MSIQVVTKTFQLLEVLSAGGTRPLGELAGEIAMPKPTVYRLLKSLQELGYVDQNQETGQYLTTWKLAQLGQGGRGSDLKERALPLMQRLHAHFNETVNLGMLEGKNVRYVHVLETTRALRLMVRPDAVDEFYSTALGRAMVAHLPESQQKSLVAAASLKALTSKTVRSKTDLVHILEETRARGWAFDDEENDDGVVCFGVPLFDDGEPVAAVSVTLPTVRATPAKQKEIVAALKGCRL